MKISAIYSNLEIPFISDQVYRPAEDSALFINYLDEDKFLVDDLYKLGAKIRIINQKYEINILDLGCGTGILGFCCVVKIMGHVCNLVESESSVQIPVDINLDFVDINPEALNTAEKLVEFNKNLLKCEPDLRENQIIPKFSYIESDLFTSIGPGSKYDIIIFNPPYLPADKIITENNRKQIDFAWDGGDDGLETLKNFFKAVGDYSHQDTNIYFIASSHTDIDSLLDFITLQNLSVEEVNKVHFFFEDIILYRAYS